MDSIRVLHERMNSDLRDILNSVQNMHATWPDYLKKWGPWVDWDGGSKYGPDIEPESNVNVYRRSPNSSHFLVTESHHVDWLHNGSENDILAYRVEICPEGKKE